MVHPPGKRVESYEKRYFGIIVSWASDDALPVWELFGHFLLSQDTYLVYFGVFFSLLGKNGLGMISHVKKRQPAL